MAENSLKNCKTLYIRENSGRIYPDISCMDSSTTNITVDGSSKPNISSNLQKVLDILHLTDKYFTKLSRDNLYKITKASLSNDLPANQKDIAYHILQRILKYDYSARDKDYFNQETLGSNSFMEKIMARSQQKEAPISPLDILIAVFLCCDHICRQDLVSHMWACRIAFPFIIQEYPDILSCFLWPLRTLSMRLETLSDVKEGLLIRMPLHIIGFTRMGDVTFSKSALINEVISGSQKVHPVFYHKDSPGSTKVRYLVDGYIDASYYLPSGRQDDVFNDAFMVLNVHGNAADLKTHREVISKIASIIIIICTMKSLRQSHLDVKEYLTNGNCVCIILTDNELSDDDISFIRSYASMQGKVDFFPVLKTNKAQMVKAIRSMLKPMMKRKECLEDIIPHLRNLKIDENNKGFKKTKERINELVDMLKTKECQERKHTFLPLQMGPMKKWAIADKEGDRIGCTRVGKDDRAYHLLTRKEDCLRKANQIIKSDQMSFIYMILSEIQTSGSNKRRLFLQFLKIELDDLSRREILPVYTNYQSLIKELSKCNEGGRESINQELEKLDKYISLFSLGLEHIFREIGYLYVATSLVHDTKYSCLPDLAAEILLDGYPFEIMDGDVNSVPITWVKDVFARLNQHILRNGKSGVQLGILSTLGIQSSGKSTMLNVLFGCQFAVSSGRCTRGVYCQLIKTDVTSKSGHQLDYILAVDTEGLRAPELSSKGNMITHDNELSTFVIGLGNKTMINLMGENTTYLEDILPISVHAFLRMEEATRLKPSCLIVHHNVDKDNRSKLLQQNRSLEKMLDKFTCIASKIQGIEIKHFKDVIHFDINTDVYYLPALLDGIPPMAAISGTYSEDLNDLRRRLVEEEVVKTQTTLSYFVDHLERLWRAIKHEDFVYQFRNTIEIQARGKFDDFWCDIHWKFRMSIQKQLSTAYTRIHNCQSKRQTEEQVSKLKRLTMNEIDAQHTSHAKEFNDWVDCVDKLFSEPIKNWHSDMTIRLDSLREDLERECINRIDELRRDKDSEISLKEKESKYRQDMVNCIKNFVKSKKPDETLQDNLDNEFENMWEVILNKTAEENPRQSTPIDFESEIFAVISSVVPNGKKDLSKLSQTNKLDQLDFKHFDAVTLVAENEAFMKLHGTSIVQEVNELKSEICERVKSRISLKLQNTRPYNRADLMDIVKIVKEEITKRSKKIGIAPRIEVYLAASACSLAVKTLKLVHQKYENDHKPRTVMENEKKYYHRMFQNLFSDVQSVQYVALDCAEILQQGITERLTRELPDKILKDIKKGPQRSILTLKSNLQLKLLTEMAESNSFHNFQTFISKPGKCIRKWISDHVEFYNVARTNSNALKQMYTATLSDIIKEVDSALRHNGDHNCDFILWLSSFGASLHNVIVLKNFHILDFAKDTIIQVDIFIDLVSSHLSHWQKCMEETMDSFLKEKFPNFRDEVVETIFNTVIGCTESCPFCGAICMDACAGHKGDHQTPHHRPKSLKGWRNITDQKLSTIACSEAVDSNNMSFHYQTNPSKNMEPILYRNYKRIFPGWNITPYAAEDEVSFWRWFLAQYAKQLAEYYGSLVPEIPRAWHVLDRKTEIQKLKERIKI